jgi:type I restriction enzyme S subunit
VGDIIIGRRGEMGRCAVVQDGQKDWLCGTGCFVLRNNSNINSSYLATLIRGESVVTFLSNNSIGATMSNLNHSILNQIILPLPPFAEQHRIVAAIESAFAVIDEIEQSKGDLAAAVSAAKSKTLSLAVSGKLVPQDESDEPAAVLLDRIRSERTSLIKAGKIKPGKRGKDAAVTRDNVIYQLVSTVKSMPSCAKTARYAN